MTYALENLLEHVPSLVAHWNSCTTEPFVMDERLMRQSLESPGALVLAEGTPWRGVLWGRRGRSGATLDAVMVRPEARLSGVGRALVEAFREGLGPEASWRFGGGDHHFVPGLPDLLAQFGGFFLALGLAPDWHAYDLLWQAPQPGAASWDESTYRLVRPDEGERLQELLRHFGTRWQEDTGQRCLALSRGEPEEIMGAFIEQRLVAFCHIWSPLSGTLGPSTFWLDRRDQAWGGIGPLGVHPLERGRGLGAGVVEAALAYLRRQGKQRIGVDWTGLPEFYQRCGFQPWLSYRGYHPK